MKYNLFKTETTEAETIKHLLTVLACYIREADELKFDKAESRWQDAEKYLKGYIKELFKQNKHSKI